MFNYFQTNLWAFTIPLTNLDSVNQIGHIDCGDDGFNGLA